MGIGSSREPLPPPGQQSSGHLGGAGRQAGRGGASGSRQRLHSHMSVQQPPDSGPGGSGLHHHLQQYLQQQQGASGSGRHRSRSLDFLSGRPGGVRGAAGGDSDEELDSDDEEDDGPVTVSGGPRPPRQRGAAAAAGRQYPAALIRQHLGVPSSFYRSDIRCPVCSKTVPHDEIEVHLVVCLTKPRISYNEDVLAEDKGAECAICFDDLCQGDTIARLPCLCIYHKGCIDEWFKRSRSCPEHPGAG